MNDIGWAIREIKAGWRVRLPQMGIDYLHRNTGPREIFEPVIDARGEPYQFSHGDIWAETWERAE